MYIYIMYYHNVLYIHTLLTVLLESYTPNYHVHTSAHMRRHKCTHVHRCEYLVIAVNISERRNLRTSVVREIVCTQIWLGRKLRS